MRMIIRERLSALALVAGILCTSTPAWAVSPETLRLFEQGRALVKDGKYEQAIPKFLESIAIEPTVGALLNLGDCYERLGKPASARRRFLEAADLAGESDATRGAEARARAAKLADSVGWVVLARRVHPEAGEPKITIDGESVPSKEARIAVDPGVREVVITYAEARPLKKRVSVRAGESIEVVIEPPLPSKTPKGDEEEKPPSPGEDGGWSTTKAIGFGTGIAGVVGLGVGITFGVVAAGKKSDLEKSCADYPRCPEATRADVQSKYDSASSAATISTIAVVAGGVLLAAGAFLFFTAPSATGPTTGKAQPFVSARSSGLRFEF